MSVMRKRRLRVAASIGLCASALSFTLVLPLRAIGAPSAESSASKTSATSSVAPRPARPYWIELTIAQRQALAPLTDDWERLDGQTKKKWVEIANRYPKMKPEEQQHTQERMREWALLTPEQCRVARDSFARVRAMPPEQRAEMLRKYQELPEEKKHELASQSQATKILVVPKPQATPSSRRAQLSEGAKLTNPAVAAQKASALRGPADVSAKPAEMFKPPQSATGSTVPAVIPNVTPAVTPLVTPSAALPAVPAQTPPADTSAK